MIARRSFILVVLLSIAYTANTLSQDAEKRFDAQFDELKASVYCYCGCVKMTIQICDCGTGQAIENHFHQRLNAGETVEQIVTDYLEQHGPQYYALMPAEGINLIAYTMPAVILVLIGGVVFAVLRKARKREKIAYSTPNSHPSDEAVKQIETELERYKQEN